MNRIIKVSLLISLGVLISETVDAYNKLFRSKSALYLFVDDQTGRVELGLGDDSEVCICFAYQTSDGCELFPGAREGGVNLSIRNLNDNNIQIVEFALNFRGGDGKDLGPNSNQCRVRSAGDALGLSFVQYTPKKLMLFLK